MSSTEPNVPDYRRDYHHRRCILLFTLAGLAGVLVLLYAWLAVLTIRVSSSCDQSDRLLPAFWIAAGMVGLTAVLLGAVIYALGSIGRDGC